MPICSMHQVSGELRGIVHRIGFLAHSCHPTVNELLILVLEPVGLFLGHVELEIQCCHFILEIL